MDRLVNIHCASIAQTKKGCNMVEWVKVTNYCMKCRLYPTENQATQIDNLLRGVHAAYNMTLYAIKEDMNYTKEVKDKKGDGVLHFPDFNEAFKSVALEKIRHENEFVNYVPGEALSSIRYGLCADMKKSWEKSGKLPVEYWSKDKGPKFYSKKNPRSSFCYSTSSNNVHTTDNENVVKVKIGSKNYSVDGLVKVRGVNNKIRFDGAHTRKFADWVDDTSTKKVVMRIEKELDCYYVVFLLKDVYKPYNVSDDPVEHVGIDVGEITLATLSDGTKYKNIFQENPRFSHDAQALVELNKQLSRRYGWKNISFRNAHKSDKTLAPSKSYLETDRRYKQISRRQSCRKNDYYNKVSAEICCKYQAIGIESLSVKDMFWYKEKHNETAKGKDKQAEKTA